MVQSIHFYCINLNRNKERWNKFINQTAINDIKKYPFERIEAVDGKKLDINNDSRVSLRVKRGIKEGTRRSHEDIVTVGAVGCYLSHVDAWKKIIDNKEPYGVVFEDDIMLPNNFMKILLEGIIDMGSLPKTADLWTFTYGWPFYYSPKGMTPAQNIPKNKVGSWIINTYPGGTHGYLITREGAKKLLRHAFPIDVHVDFYMCMCIELNQIECVANKGLILDVFNNPSNIQHSMPCLICNIPTKNNIFPKVDAFSNQSDVEKDTSCLICDVPTNLYPLVIGLLFVSAGFFLISSKSSFKSRRF